VRFLNSQTAHCLSAGWPIRGVSKKEIVDAPRNAESCRSPRVSELWRSAPV
jgi:hypothetical protein